MTINRLKFLSTIEPCSKVANGKREIEKHLLIEAGEKLTVKGTDGNIFVSRTIPYEGILGESICLYASVLRNFVSASTGEDVELNIEGSTAILTCGKAKSRLPFLDGRDFTTIEFNGSATCMTLDVSSLPLIKGAMLASDQMTTKTPILSGNAKSVVRLTPSENGITAACTNTQVAIECAVNGSSDDVVLLPGMFVGSLLSIGAKEGSFKVLTYRNAIVCSGDDWEIAGPASWGSFPPIERVFNVSSSHRLVIDPQEFEQAINSALSFLSPDEIRIICSGFGESITVSANGRNGDFETSVNVRGDASDFKFAANYRYLLAMCKTCIGPMSILESVTPQKIQFRSSDPTWKGVIMPLALS